MFRVALFEDAAWKDLCPLVWTRPVFETLCGRFTLRERFVRRLPITQWGAFLRESLAAPYRHQYPEAVINDITWLQEEPTLLVNGRWIGDPFLLAELGQDEVLVLDGVPVAVHVQPDESMLFAGCLSDSPLEQLVRLRKKSRAADGVLVRYPWELVDLNGAQLVDDLSASDARLALNKLPAGVSLLGPMTNVRIHQTAHLDPYVVLDARQGPITIGPRANIEAFTRLEGPCHIGAETNLYRADIRSGTTIGYGSMVGGEIEASILQAYVTKCHEGFLGHSYVCPWATLGALATAGDQRHDYTTVRVPLAGEPIDTGRVQVGSFIGDHANLSMGSLLNTGSSIGVMSLVLPDGELMPKFIPSFTRVWHGLLEELPDWEVALAGARQVMERRNYDLAEVTEHLLAYIFTETRPGRLDAIERRLDRRRGQQAIQRA